MPNRNLLPLVRTASIFLPPKNRLNQQRFYSAANLDVYSYNRAIQDLIQSGSLHSALKLFDEMPERDVVSWNTMISGYSRHGIQREALCLYREMVSEGIRESSSTFSSVLSICKDQNFHIEGLQVHCRLISFGFSLKLNVYIGSALIDLYIHMGLTDIALKLFDEMPERNIAIWNIILSGFCEMGESYKSLELYSDMILEGIKPNALTFCYLIRGCGNEKLCIEGEKLHCHMIKSGWLNSNLFCANSLVDFYSTCGNLIEARRSFDVIKPENVISWNSIVSVYAYNGLCPDAIDLFRNMQFWGKKPSIRSYLGFLSLCSETENLQFGKQIHSHVLKLGFFHKHIHIQSSLIDMYGKCNDIENSVSIFEYLHKKTRECCNSLMSSFLRSGFLDDVVEMFVSMVNDEAIGFDEVSLSTMLKAISISSSSFFACELLHSCAIKSGFKSEIAVSCSLIDSYSRFGQIEFSRMIFDEICVPNVICFTSMITAYSRNGFGTKGIEILDLMIRNGQNPDRITFLSVLIGCNHSGLIEEGKQFFESMKKIHGYDPDRQHYSCMVDLLGRAGLLDEVEELLKEELAKNDCVMWSSLLRNCRVHQNEEIGRRAAKMVMELQPEDPAVWLQASNFYCEIGEFKISKQIREVAMARRFSREIGHSLIEVNG